MSKSGLAIAASVAALALGGAFALTAAEGTHWSYNGSNGPANWSNISQDYAACGTGKEQSPIDLRPTHMAETKDLAISWKPFDAKVVNNGHTIQANAPSGNFATLGGKRYDLLQLHFHHQSEHTLSGERKPMEAHFVHKSAEGDLMVLGVFLVPGEANGDFQSILGAAPEGKGQPSGAAQVDLTSLLPDDRTIYRYAGSLTTPPCSEIVSWVVFEEPVEVSAKQIETFAASYPDNFRPIQPVNRRFVLRGD